MSKTQIEMRNVMKVRINDHTGEIAFFTCACSDCVCENPNEPIPTYYSYKHAVDSGWVFTHDIKYCEPGSLGPAAVCPTCYER